MSSFTPTGITIDRMEDIFDKIIADLKSYWGDNIKTDPQSSIGARVTIFSEAIADQNELIEAVVSAFQPSKATGVYLSELVKLNGITRNEAEFSTVALTLTANSAGTTVPAGSLVADPDTGVQFAIDSPVVIPPSGIALGISATAVDSGPVVAEAGTLTQIVNPVYGWALVNNPADAIVGFNEESDTELRARREVAASQTASSGVRGIYTAIADIQEVTDVYVHDNKGTTTDSFGVPAGHIWAIVEGGSNADIAEAIFSRLAAGIGMFGSTTHLLADAVTGQTYAIKFSRPTEVDIYISMTLEKSSSYPGDGDDQIKDAISDWFDDVQKIAKDVEWSRLFDPINSIPGHTVSELYIGFTTNPTGTANLPISINEKAVIDIGDISITGI